MENSNKLMANQQPNASRKNDNSQRNVPTTTNNENNTQNTAQTERRDFVSSQPIPFRNSSLRTQDSSHLHISPLLPPPSSSVLSNYEQSFWNDTPVYPPNYYLPPLHSSMPLPSISYPLPSSTRTPLLPQEYLEVGSHSPPWMTQMIKDHNLQIAEHRMTQLKQKIKTEEKKSDKVQTTEPNFVTPATLQYVSNNLSLFLNGSGPDDTFWKSKFKNQPPGSFPEVRQKFEKDPNQRQQ